MDQYKVEWQYIDTLFLRLSKEEFFSIACIPSLFQTHYSSSIIAQIGIQLDEKSTKYEWLSTIQSYFVYWSISAAFRLLCHCLYL